MQETLERELKLSVERGFRLPDLPGRPLPRRTLTSSSYDTADIRLARAGITLRRRVENRKGVWQLKLPRGIARLELEVPGGPGDPPVEILDLLPAYLRGSPLGPVATLRTKRSGVRATDERGTVADVTVDSVSVQEDGRSIGSFRELEVELIEGDEKGLKRIGRALRAAGASDGDGRPKLFRALDHPAPTQPEAPRRDAPAAEHVRAMLEQQYRAVVAHDPGTRLGRDPEELHQMRVATRRLRAFLRAARPLLDQEWAESLRSEVGWLGSVLGPVRDLDVLLEHLHSDASGLEPKERRALRRIFRRLELERAEAHTAMLAALQSERYLALLDRLEEAARAPVLAAGAEEVSSLQDIAAHEYRRLRKAVRALDDEPADADLHEIRIHGKRARYAAEMAEPVVGKPATRFVREAKAFQDVLGEHQDAVVAEERLRGLLLELGGAATAFSAGRLVERQRERRAEARAAFPGAWKALARRGRQAWR
jgi:CHAD domain-containing protein